MNTEEGLDAPVENCECGTATGFPCAAELFEDAVLLEYMPEFLRRSHEAAGNSGVYPHNGATRFRCAPDCADLLIEENPGWAEIVEVSS